MKVSAQATHLLLGSTFLIWQGSSTRLGASSSRFLQEEAEQGADTVVLDMPVALVGNDWNPEDAYPLQKCQASEHLVHS